MSNGNTTQTMSNSNLLKVGALNINGLTPINECEIVSLLDKGDFDVFMLSETHRRENELRSPLCFQGYDIYCIESGENDRLGGGLATLVKKDIPSMLYEGSSYTLV